MEFPVLAYHKVCEQWELSFTMMYPKTFERQMRYLAKKGYVGKSLRAYINDPRDNYFVLTFDDAYQSVFANAYPLLKELGFTATVFVLTNYIGKNNTWDFVPGNIFSKHMKEDELKILHAEGWEIASHGENHRAMTGMAPELVVDELKRSKDIISLLTGEEVKTFCFPFGVYNAAVVKAARACGYKYLVGYTEPSRHGVISRSAVYRLIDGKRSVLRKVRRRPVGFFIERLKEAVVHSTAIFPRMFQRLRSRKT